MMLIGLAGVAGCGKDTIADWLVQNHAFTKFSFGDALYREVAQAFCGAAGYTEDEFIKLLQDRNVKEMPSAHLTADRCGDGGFARMMRDYAVSSLGHTHALGARSQRFSPRWVLQRWGTEYRRAQDPGYWVKRAELWIKAWLEVTTDDGEYHAGLVNTSVRFPNEQALIHSLGGIIWHVRREHVLSAGVASLLDHQAEQGLPTVQPYHEIANDGTIDQLRTRATLLLQAEPPGSVESIVAAMLNLQAAGEPVPLEYFDADKATN